MIAKPGEPLPGRAWLDRLARDLRRRSVRRSVSATTLYTAMRVLEATEALNLPAPSIVHNNGGLCVELTATDGRGLLLIWHDDRPGEVKVCEYLGFGAKGLSETRCGGAVRVDRIRARLDWLMRGARAAS